MGGTVGCTPPAAPAAISPRPASSRGEVAERSEAGEGLTLVDVFERAIEALWRAHGERMAELHHLRAARNPRRHSVPAHDIDVAAPDVDF